MSDKARKEGRDFANFLRSLPEALRAQKNKEGRDRVVGEHHQFQEYFRAGKCSTCGSELRSFNNKNPCVHWLLMPPGFTKRHFADIAHHFGIFQIQSFLRWVANEDALGRNINDLRDEGTGKLIELTIRYGDCEWGFSCGVACCRFQRHLV